jgi:hypothetical protein
MIRDLVKNTLRMRPDRIVVGECRGAEALDMLQAMNTGHDGSLTTIHSNGPRDTLSRIETMVLMAGFDLPVRAIREQVASAVDLIVHVARLRDGTRRITHITEVEGMEGEIITLQDLFLFDFGEGVDERPATSRAGSRPPASAPPSPRTWPPRASASRPTCSNPSPSPVAAERCRWSGEQAPPPPHLHLGGGGGLSGRRHRPERRARDRRGQHLALRRGRQRHDGAGFRNLAEPLNPEQLSITADGGAVENLVVEPLAQSTVPVGVVLAIDTSGSMEGEPIEAARERRPQLRQPEAPRGLRRHRHLRRRGAGPAGLHQQHLDAAGPDRHHRTPGRPPSTTPSSARSRCSRTRAPPASSPTSSSSPTAPTTGPRTASAADVQAAVAESNVRVFGVALEAPTSIPTPFRRWPMPAVACSCRPRPRTS